MTFNDIFMVDFIGNFAGFSTILLHIYFLYRTLDTKIILKKQIIVSVIFVVVRMFYYGTGLGYKPYVSLVMCIIYASIMFVGRLNEYFIWSLIGIVLDGIVEAWITGLYVLIPNTNIRQVEFYGDMYIFVVIIAKTLLFFLYHLVTKKVDKSASISFEYSVLIAAFPIGCWILIDTLFIYRGTLTDISTMPVMFVISTVLLIMMVCVVKLYNSIILHAKELTKFKLELLKVEMTQEHTDQINNIYEKLSRLKHDLINHFSVIMGYIDTEQYSLLKNYIKKIVSFNFDIFPYSKQPVINTLISSSVEKAEKQNIDFNVNVEVPENIPISDVDVCILLSNILDNAFDSNKLVTTNKYIKPDICVEQIYWRIDCRNSTTNATKLKNTTELKSTKKSSENHGIGTKEICEIAEKTGGFVVFSCENYEFSTVAMIKL